MTVVNHWIGGRPYEAAPVVTSRWSNQPRRGKDLGFPSTK